MKAHLKHFAQKIDFWNLFIGIIIGFALGVVLINALVPNANQLIYMYHLQTNPKVMDTYHTFVK